MHQSLRLRILNEILAANKGSDNFPSDLVFPAIRNCVNASVAEQRKAAMQVTVTLYKALVDWKKLEPLFTTGFSQKIMQQLKGDIPELQQYIKTA